MTKQKNCWKTPKNLKELLEIPEELEPFVNDYQIHVVEVAWLTDEQLQLYKSDFRVVAEYFVQKRKNQEYSPTPQTLKHVDAVLKMLSVFGGADQLKELYQARKEEEKGGDVTMCEMLDRTISRRVAEATEKIKEKLTEEVTEEITERITEEVTERITEEVTERITEEVGASYFIQTIKTLQKALNCSISEALHAFGKTPEEYEHAISVLHRT